MYGCEDVKNAEKPLMKDSSKIRLTNEAIESIRKEIQKENF